MSGFQDLATVNYHVRSIAERQQALEQTPMDLLVAGANAQDKTPWLAMQTWLEENCIKFLHSNIYTSGDAAFRYWTLAEWRAAGRINANGFERTTDKIATLYGRIQAGDIITYRIPVELVWQLLHFTPLNPSATVEDFGGFEKTATASVDVGGWPSNPGAKVAKFVEKAEAMKAALSAAWAAASWTAVPANGVQYKTTITPVVTESGIRWDATDYGRICQMRASGIPTFRAANATLAMMCLQNIYPPPYRHNGISELETVPVSAGVAETTYIDPATITAGVNEALGNLNFLDNAQLDGLYYDKEAIWNMEYASAVGDDRYVYLEWDWTHG
jgi:hypothetical protein